VYGDFYYYYLFLKKFGGEFFFHRFVKNIFVRGTFCCKFPDFLKKIGGQKSPQLHTI
jgi:hypothetical protein